MTVAAPANPAAAAVPRCPACGSGRRPGAACEACGDGVEVLSADALAPTLWRDGPAVGASARPSGRPSAREPARLSREALEDACARIAALHRPTVPEALLEAA